MSRALILLLSLVAACLSVVLPLSQGGVCLAIGQCLLCFSLLFRFHSRTERLLCLLTALAALAVPVVGRTQIPLSPRYGDFTTGPDGNSVRSVNKFLSEEDGIYLGMKFLSLLGGITPNEADGLIPILESAYQKMRKKEGDFPTALISTMLWLESDRAFDVLSFRPEACKNGSDAALIFLHGTGGNWSLLCFLVAEAAREQGYETVCPSIGLWGMWGSDKGQRILDSNLQALKARGKKTFVLAGLSAGGIGAAELAKDFASELQGVALLFGSHPDISSVRIPTLHIYARQDERIPQRWLANFADLQRKQFSDVEVHALDDNHFSLVKQPELSQSILSAWLARITPRKANCAE